MSIELDSARAQVLEIQGLLKDKEKSEQHLQGKLRDLKESFEQKKKHSETLQAELKTALLEKVRLTSYSCKKININLIHPLAFIPTSLEYTAIYCSLAGKDKIRMWKQSLQWPLLKYTDSLGAEFQ